MNQYKRTRVGRIKEKKIEIIKLNVNKQKREKSCGINDKSCKNNNR